MNTEISTEDMDPGELLNYPQYTKSAIMVDMKFVIHMLLSVISKLRETTYSSEKDNAIAQSSMMTKFIHVKRKSNVHQSSTKSLFIKLHTYLSPLM